MKNASMTRLFLRGMVWVVYPLMALMVGAMAVGGRSEGRMIAYVWVWLPPYGEVIPKLVVVDLDHDLSVLVTDGVNNSKPIEWMSENSLFYFRNDLSQRMVNGYRPGTYEVYHLNGQRNTINLPNEPDMFAMGFSPDRAQFGYVQAGLFYVRELQTGQVTQITNKVIFPPSGFRWEWSPDNCRLAYLEALQSWGADGEIIIHDICTGEQFSVAEDVGWITNSDIAWSPSGNHLAFVASDRNYAITTRVIDLDTMETLVLDLPSSTYGNGISWSPTSNQFTFSAAETDGQPSNIYVADVEHGTVTRITGLTSEDFAPQWSPDGRQIAFVSQLQGSRFDDFQLYVMNVDGSNIQRISDVPNYVISAQWSPLP